MDREAEASPPRDVPEAPSEASSVGGLSKGRRLISRLRREEIVLGVVLGLSAVLCWATGTGFQFESVFMRYVYFFVVKVMILLLATRLLLAVARAWHPHLPVVRRVKRWLFADGSGDLLRTDLEFSRGLLLLFVTLVVYSNVKIRVMYLNATIGDPLFQKLDHLVFGTRLWPWLERTFEAHDWLQALFGKIYFHDYMYMVFLVFLLYLRKDQLTIRWTFVSVALLYIVGILITVLYPSYGPCFVALERYEWIQHGGAPGIAGAQRGLLQLQIEFDRAQLAGGQPLAKAFGGIAAFPSLHVAHMALLAAIAWNTVRPYAYLMVLMALLTFVATMGFGWHYAVDGIGGVALALVVAWWTRRTVVGGNR